MTVICLAITTAWSKRYLCLQMPPNPQEISTNSKSDTVAVLVYTQFIDKYFRSLSSDIKPKTSNCSPKGSLRKWSKPKESKNLGMQFTGESFDWLLELKSFLEKRKVNQRMKMFVDDISEQREESVNWKEWGRKVFLESGICWALR